MHVSCVFCIPLKTKTAKEVVQAYLHHVYSKFGGSEKILSDNGTEFKNKLFKKVADQLGVEYKVYTPPYRPQCNGKIEGFHKYLKSCIAKHIINNMEWDDFIDLAMSSLQFCTKCYIERIPILSHVWKRSIHAPKQTLVTSNKIPWNR